MVTPSNLALSVTGMALSLIAKKNFYSSFSPKSINLNFSGLAAI